MTIETGKIYLQKKNSRLIESINQVLILLDAITIASTLIVDGKVEYEPGSFGRLDCKQFELDVLLPVHDPLNAAVSERFPDEIQFEVVARPEISKAHAVKTSGLSSVILNAVTPVFVKFFEDNKSFLDTKFPSGPQDWPPVWDFARVVRNACSHGGKIHYTSSSPRAVKWHNLGYDISNEGDLVVGGDLAFGDFILLLLEMSDALDALGCPK